MNRLCPYCESEALEEADGGAVLRCGDCGKSCLPGAVAAREDALSDPLGPRTRHAALGLDGRPGRVMGQRSAPGEVPSLPAALMALGSTALFYGLLYLVPSTRFSELFMDRGWVPYVITTISAWALFLLGTRALRLRREARVLSLDLIETPADGRLRPADAEAALAWLGARPRAIAETFLARRIERALRHYRARRRAVEVVEFLASESRADEGRVDASYGLVRVFVWAVPTLGFIGTVIGIGAAVAGFSETLDAASSLDGMKASIGTVTGGLGVAFDTTLLALVMSIVIMFPASAVQRIEEGFLGDIDDYCAEHLVGRMEDEAEEGGGTGEDALVEALANRLLLAMRQREHGRGEA